MKKSVSIITLNHDLAGHAPLLKNSVIIYTISLQPILTSKYGSWLMKSMG